MKTKILQALKTKYKNLGFGDKAFDGVADHLSKTITEETQIDTAVAEVETLLKAFQGDNDKLRGERTNLQKELDELKAKQEGGSSATVETKEKEEENVPAWAKALMEKVDTLSTDKLATTRVSKFNEVIKDLPEKQREFMSLGFNPTSFKDDSEFEAHIEKIQTLVPDIIQEQANTALGKMGKPGGGGDTKTEAEDFAKRMAEINKSE